jgi:hypothetical protein
MFSFRGTNFYLREEKVGENMKIFILPHEFHWLFLTTRSVICSDTSKRSEINWKNFATLGHPRTFGSRRRCQKPIVPVQEEVRTRDRRVEEGLGRLGIVHPEV